MTHGTFELGPTGEYPDGKLHSSDEGELTMAVGIVNDRIVLELGTSVKWVGLAPSDARALADLLLEKANTLQPLPQMKEAPCSCRTRAVQLLDDFEDQAQQVNERMRDSRGVTHLTAYAAQEQIWHQASKRLMAAFGNVLPSVDDEDDDEQWHYGDAIDFGQVEDDTGGDRPSTPEEIEQRMQQAADGAKSDG
jgi:hypothetical protein